MASIVEAVRARFDSSNHLSNEAIETWQSHHLFPAHNPVYEFCLQTAFMQFVHAYLLRICEEYVLVPPCPSRESDRAGWFSSSMQRMLQLLSNLDNSKYARFAHCFDWFPFDEQHILQLYHHLRQYHISTQDNDLLGKVYNEGFIEQRNRSEKGQFYTPSHVVSYILDTLEIPSISDADNDTTGAIGYTKYQKFLARTLADLSCGSGSFLVATAARKRALLQHLVATGEITCSDALHILTGTLVGFDFNPFACYLSTINLLVQCLPFLLDQREDAGKTDGVSKASPLQFSIYCLDALDVQAMEQAGFGKCTFDYLVGNPPYVSANESATNLLYRNKIWNCGHYHLLSQKWDLFVPFFERNLQLLRPESGHLGLIVSSGIETEGYAQRLRESLCRHYILLQIDFFPDLRVFPHAGIESTIVFAENRAPGETHTVKRRRHLRASLASFDTLPPVRQLAEEEQIFRWRYQPALSTGMAHDSIPLCAIAYIGTGIEAQSSEHTEQIIDGQRHKRFTLHDVFVLPSGENERPPDFPDDGVLGDDVDNYYLRRERYVAYERYQPSMRGPRHPALFRTPEKLLLGETSGGYYDTEQLFANHSVQVVVPWHALVQSGALQETGIARVLHRSQQISGMTDFAPVSQQFDLRYILAILNSRFMRRYLASNLHQGTRKGRIYPDIWKRLPIKLVPLAQQKEIAQLVEAVQEEYRHLAKLGELKNKDTLMKVNSLINEIETWVELYYV